MKKFKEWLSVQLAKNPGRIVLFAILAFNIVFFFAAAGVISALHLNGTEQMPFIIAAYYTINMVIDPGSISEVVSDVGETGVAITITCLVVVLVGMICFTGAVIGYVTNTISSFIEDSNSGKRKLHLSGHTVILNWNSRASEIINDMLYRDTKQTVVVLVSENKDEIQAEIDAKLKETVARENSNAEKELKDLPFFKRVKALKERYLKKNVTVVVREGDVFSLTQLKDISIEKAESIIILGNDNAANEDNRGNVATIKTLMQVADIASNKEEKINQKIVVEITDTWTGELVDRIIKAKTKEGKCQIIPINVNIVLGQIFSEFCLMPELNMVYNELFSSRGAEFYSVPVKMENEVDFVRAYLTSHSHAIPLTVVQKGEKAYSYYVAGDEKDVSKASEIPYEPTPLEINYGYQMEHKNVLILGHNSKSKEIMTGFDAFSQEWKLDEGEILRVVVIDDKESLEKMNYYKEYPFVCKTVEADIYDRDIINSTINEFVRGSGELDTSILILSDDNATSDETDAKALANLIYVREVIDKHIEENPKFDINSIDLIVEIIDPKHHDVVSSYSVNNVVISNRYISKMINQISQVEELFDFYVDILTFDTDEDAGDSKEVYIKKAGRFLNKLPGKTSALCLVRTVFEESVNEKKTKAPSPSILLGYVRNHTEVVIFEGDLSKIQVELLPDDKLILFASH